MNKIKYLLLFVCIAGCFTACKNNDTDTFDAQAQFTSDTTAIRAFIVKNNIPAIKDKSGIFYQIIAPGAGTVVYNGANVVTADYEGRLLGGSVFDSSKGTAIEFRLDGVIKGWTIGIPFIQPGGKIRLLIPSLYGYGNRAVGPIPANSVLDFTVNLVTAK